MHVCVWKGECDLWKSGLYSFCYPQNNLRASSSFGRLARLATKAFLKNSSESTPFFFIFSHFYLAYEQANMLQILHAKTASILDFHLLWIENFSSSDWDSSLSSRSAFFQKVPSLFLRLTYKILGSSISTWQSETNAVAAKDCDLWQCELCQSRLSDRNFTALPLQLTLTNKCCLLAVQEDW